jgi:hypothetical protein
MAVSSVEASVAEDRGNDSPANAAGGRGMGEMEAIAVRQRRARCGLGDKDDDHDHDDGGDSSAGVDGERRKPDMTTQKK